MTAAIVTLYSLFGYRFDHRNIRVTDTNLYEALLAWGLEPQIVNDSPEIEFQYGIQAGAMADPDGIECALDCRYNRTIQHCTITANQVYFASLDAATRRAIYIHEVGHCLGLAHDDTSELSLMHSGTPASLLPTPFDLEKITVLYGTKPQPNVPPSMNPFYQYTIRCPMVAR